MDNATEIGVPKFSYHISRDISEPAIKLRIHSFLRRSIYSFKEILFIFIFYIFRYTRKGSGGILIDIGKG